MDTSQLLVGLVVHKAEEIHDYLQVTFHKSATLNIYNRYHCEKCTIASIKGKKVVFAVDTTDAVVIDFGEGRLFVGKSDKDYNGPETMTLLRKGAPPVVWK